jgi:hypothetical protein
MNIPCGVVLMVDAGADAVAVVSVVVLVVLSLLVLSALVLSEPLQADKKSNTAAKKDIEKIRVDFIVYFFKELKIVGQDVIQESRRV